MLGLTAAVVHQDINNFIAAESGYLLKSQVGNGPVE